MKLSDAQFGALVTLSEHGTVHGEEVDSLPVKLVCHAMAGPTLNRLEIAGLVRVTRGAGNYLVDATGRRGRPRRTVAIEITQAGRDAIAAALART